MGLVVIILSALLLILTIIYDMKADDYNDLKKKYLFLIERYDYQKDRKYRLMLENYRLTKLLKEHDIDEGIGIDYGMDFIDKFIRVDS